MVLINFAAKLSRMIQRIQSIYLLIAALVTVAIYWFPLATFDTYIVYACHIEKPENAQALLSMVPLAAFPLVGTLLAIFSIFKFKNRMLQLKLNRLNMLVLLTSMAIEAVLYFRIETLVPAQGKPGFASILPLVAICFIWLANRGIKHDERLVRSADRIR
ncbi:MAG TPA: DUF4293 domain-containing protein [Marinilabiliales bacterium]|nr:DUF4293 domain-containing protein [Marinilabiliales bacterium]